MTMPPAVAAWHALVESADPAGLSELLDEAVVFHSPAVHAPQVGRALTTTYLTAALVVLGPVLRYTEEWYNADSAVLAFEADLDGTMVQGIDLLRWNPDDRLIDFTVMVRPYRGLEKLVELMGQELLRG
jgi:hypothetical protein